MLLLPAAFTKVTGQAHWEILIRARAIENQAFVVAADQVGPHPPDKVSFGGSMIVDPVGRGAGPALPTRSASWPPTWTSTARTRSARSSRASPTACPTPIAGSAEVGA